MRIADLRCHRCGNVEPGLDGVLSCAVCQDGLLLVTPATADRPDRGTPSAQGIWRWAGELPRIDLAARVSLGEGGTPLLPMSASGRVGRVWIKNEGNGPTQSYKDRFNAVNVSVARHWGRPGVALKSTGNAGLAASAYCASAGLRAQVVCSPDVPSVVLRGMQDYGAEIHLAPQEKHLGLLAELLADGYFPGSRSVPPDSVTPYGCEGYKTIAYEIVDELGGAPDSVVVPVGGGDGLYGVHRGFADLVERRVIEKAPQMIAARTTWPGASSIAFDVVGAHALDAVASSGGAVVSVSRTEIESAVRELEGMGVSPEPASASTLAALRRTDASLGDVVVAVVTGGGLKWKVENP